jgi:hypothetical protein
MSSTTSMSVAAVAKRVCASAKYWGYFSAPAETRPARCSREPFR